MAVSLSMSGNVSLAHNAWSAGPLPSTAGLSWDTRTTTAAAFALDASARPCLVRNYGVSVG